MFHRVAEQWQAASWEAVSRAVTATWYQRRNELGVQFDREDKGTTMKPTALSGLRKSCASLSTPSVTNLQYYVTFGGKPLPLSQPRFLENPSLPGLGARSELRLR